MQMGEHLTHAAHRSGSFDEEPGNTLQIGNSMNLLQNKEVYAAARKGALDGGVEME